MKNGFNELVARFEAGGLPNPEEEAKKLFDHLGSIDQDKIGDIIEKRLKGMPVEYILGEAFFMGRGFYCTQSTLIPTPETAALVNEAVEILSQIENNHRHLNVIDIGTGCGNLAICIALEVENCKIFATDISHEALEVARSNIDRYGLGDRVSIHCGDLFDPLVELDIEGSIDLIVCNPPYIPSRSVNNLPSSIIDYEPRTALDAGPFGMDIIMGLIENSYRYLKKDGSLMFEVGKGQERFVNRLLKKNGGYSSTHQMMYGDDVRGFLVRK